MWQVVVGTRRCLCTLLVLCGGCGGDGEGTVCVKRWSVLVVWKVMVI